MVFKLASLASFTKMVRPYLKNHLWDGSVVFKFTSMASFTIYRDGRSLFLKNTASSEMTL